MRAEKARRTTQPKRGSRKRLCVAWRTPQREGKHNKNLEPKTDIGGFRLESAEHVIHTARYGSLRNGLDLNPLLSGRALVKLLNSVRSMEAELGMVRRVCLFPFDRSSKVAAIAGLFATLNYQRLTNAVTVLSVLDLMPSENMDYAADCVKRPRGSAKGNGSGRVCYLGRCDRPGRCIILVAG